MKNRIIAKPNPHPDSIPTEVWDAHQHFFADRNKDNAQKNWNQYLKILNSYKQEKGNFLKDGKGGFVKMEEKEVRNG